MRLLRLGGEKPAYADVVWGIRYSAYMELLSSGVAVLLKAILLKKKKNRKKKSKLPAYHVRKTCRVSKSLGRSEHEEYN